ncbi:MAG: hypothetical protein EZS28_025779 [Streblomastix strix]|uniref:Uncharacterized protein n=1 Tax=Streblomastix strix TaxID=222440 RepID=A0A5J4V883_9EUKA|nr:MAG: hypothetical protein EZS28_025779 [Streblomastix strix]
MVTSHQTFASECIFRTASESRRGSLNESISSDFSQSEYYEMESETGKEDEEEFIPTEFQLKMHMKYQKFLV